MNPFGSKQFRKMLTTFRNSRKPTIRNFIRKHTLQNRVLVGIAIKDEMDLFCYQNRTTMQLMMYIGNDFIESVKLDPDRVSKPGYLGTFKRNLKIKYKEEIGLHGSPADFIVVGEVKKDYSDKINNLIKEDE
jgi:hypothetical protein